ncbi:MAG: alpha/beta hydrolase-fold protein [Sphingomonadaceae bacterium]
MSSPVAAITLPRRALLAGLVAAPALAQEGFVLPGTEVHRIDAPALGRRYRIDVWLPESYETAPERRYPVLYTTDSPASFPLIRGVALRIRDQGRVLEDFILVGLGFCEGDSGTTSRRRDYTPSPHGDIDARPSGPGAVVRYGEAEPYRLFVRDEVFPFIDARYRTDPARRLYIGHSYGGLFGTHVLLTEPRMFARYALLSPSLWYDRRLMIARERGYATLNRDLPADVLFLIGANETVPEPDTEPFGAARHAMVEDLAEMVRMLRSRNYPSLRVEERVIPGEDHATVYPVALPQVLEWLLPGSGRAEPKRCLDAEGRRIANCRWPERWQD